MATAPSICWRVASISWMSGTAVSGCASTARRAAERWIFFVASLRDTSRRFPSPGFQKAPDALADVGRFHVLRQAPEAGDSLAHEFAGDPGRAAGDRVVDRDGDLVTGLASEALQLADIAVRTGTSGRSARFCRRAGRCTRRGWLCAPDVRGAVHGERTTSSVHAPDAGMSRTHRWWRRRRRADRHGSVGHRGTAASGAGPAVASETDTVPRGAGTRRRAAEGASHAPSRGTAASGQPCGPPCFSELVPRTLARPRRLQSVCSGRLRPPVDGLVIQRRVGPPGKRWTSPRSGPSWSWKSGSTSPATLPDAGATPPAGTAHARTSPQTVSPT